MANVAQLDHWDYLTLTACVVLTSIPGVYFSFKTKKSASLKEFLAVNSRISFIPIILSAAATNLSAISILGIPTEVYHNGMSFFTWSLSTLMVIPMAAYLFIPVYYKINKSSIYEYLEMRFDSSIMRKFASLTMGIQVIFLTATGIYAPALAINQVTGLHLWAIIGVIGSVSVIYTSIGGFKAVVWSDAFQFLVMTFTILLILIKGTVDIGGVNVIWERLVSGNRSDIILLSENPNTMYTIWVMAIANPFQKIGYMILNQSMMQRYLSNPSLKKAQTSAAVVLFTVVLYVTIEILLGCVIYAYYYNCDPLLNGQLKKRDQIVALFSVEILKNFVKGCSGLFIGGLVCASISTASSSLNSLAIITISDFITPFKSDISNKCLLRLSKILVFIYGASCIALIAIIEKQSGIISVFFTIISLMSSPVIMLIFMGMLLPWVNKKGAVVGFLASFILPWWAWIGKVTSSIKMPHAPFSIEGCTNATMLANKTLIFYNNVGKKTYLEQFYSFHPFWYTLWSLVVGISVSLIISKFTGFENLNKANPDHFFPFVRKFIIKRNARLNINTIQDIKELKVLINPTAKPMMKNITIEKT